MTTFDWDKVNSVVNPNRNVLPYEATKQFFTKVAFDVFQLNTTPAESLWVLEKGEDGKQYLVAMYEAEATNLQTQSSDWNALIDKEAANITLLYKDSPIRRFAGADYGFSTQDAHLFKNVLIDKLSQDKDFRKELINSFGENKRQELISQFPELA